MSSLRLQLLVNPAAGGGRGARALPAVLGALAEHDVVVTPTSSLAHAGELVAGAVTDERIVVAMGGDGLVGTVAGLVAELDAVMAVIPAGRGNDFCRAVGLPRKPVAAASALRTAVPTALDLGEANGRPFLGIASVGFDSEVQERVLTSRLPLGQLVYGYGALATIARWRPARFSCTIDGSPLEAHGWFVAVANSGVYGGGMRLAPQASLRDGLLDVVVSGETSRARFLRALPKVFRGTHIREPSVSLYQGTSVVLSADRPFRVFADGDPIASLPCTVTIRARAVRVLLPATTMTSATAG